MGGGGRGGVAGPGAYILYIYWDTSPNPNHNFKLQSP